MLQKHRFFQYLKFSFHFLFSYNEMYYFQNKNMFKNKPKKLNFTFYLCLIQGNEDAYGNKRSLRYLWFRVEEIDTIWQKIWKSDGKFYLSCPQSAMRTRSKAHRWASTPLTNQVAMDHREICSAEDHTNENRTQPTSNMCLYIPQQVRFICQHFQLAIFLAFLTNHKSQPITLSGALMYFQGQTGAAFQKARVKPGKNIKYTFYLHRDLLTL